MNSTSLCTSICPARITVHTSIRRELSTVVRLACVSPIVIPKVIQSIKLLLTAMVISGTVMLLLLSSYLLIRIVCDTNTGIPIQCLAAFTEFQYTTVEV